ncbi:MAG: hypothetical protein M1596_06120 [Firmicutes bacterium]|nr:hypothetical protein [Bacillota bacterium]
MYLPSFVFVGPLPLFVVLMIVALLLTSFVLSRYHAPEHVRDLLWYGVLGAVLGEKGIYIITAFHYYLLHPAHLIFTPQSTLGTWGLGLGAGLAVILVFLTSHSLWKRTDWDALALALGPGLTVLSLGLNWLGFSSNLPLFSVAYHHLDRFATFFLFSLCMGMISLVLFISHHTHRYAPGQLAGIFSFFTAISLVLAQFTAVRAQFQLSAVDWMAMALALTGYLLMGPARSGA